LFLRLLGDQTLQLTIKNKGVAITSWILKTTEDAVESIKIIPGRTEQDSINLELDLVEFEFGGNGVRNIIDDIRIVGKMIASNRGVRKQPNMVRLFMAGGIESLVGYVRTTGQTRQD
jgi:hypothetical protein